MNANELELNQGDTVRVKLTDEAGGREVIGIVLGFTHSRVTLSDACYADTREAIGILTLRFDAICEFEVVK